MALTSRRPDGAGERAPEGAAPGAGDRGLCRRDFLRTMGALPVGLAAAQRDRPSVLVGDGAGKLPWVPLGRHRISRLACGANPFHGGSHLSVFVNREMKAYYTLEQTLKTLRRCEEVGINLWQAGSRHVETYRQHRAGGGTMHYISLGQKNQKASEEIRRLVDLGCIGIAHHGEVTDRLFKAGRVNEVGEYLKQVRDAGLMVGVSTHMPAVVDLVESKGWDVDFYMTCAYERHRSAEDLEKLLGQAPIPVGEVYLPLDPPRMFKVVRQTKRPCLVFKILAAGRLSERREWVEDAFRRTFESIKPIDAVIVGMYDRYSDQPAENAALVRRFSPLSGSAAER